MSSPQNEAVLSSAKESDLEFAAMVLLVAQETLALVRKRTPRVEVAPSTPPGLVSATALVDNQSLLRNIMAAAGSKDPGPYTEAQAVDTVGALLKDYHDALSAITDQQGRVLALVQENKDLKERAKVRPIPDVAESELGIDKAVARRGALAKIAETEGLDDEWLDSLLGKVSRFQKVGPTKNGVDGL